MKTIFILFQILICFKLMAQQPCEFSSDSLSLTNFSKKEFVDFMEVTIKNNYQFQFIKQDKKLFLKIIVTDNLGFGHSGSFLLLSKKKQIGIKDINLIQIDKKSGYFIFELNSNYLQTIKDNGVTSFVFRDAVEFNVPKTDSEKIKQLAACFFDKVIPK